MSLRLTMRLVEEMGVVPAGSAARIEVDGPDEVETVRRWAESSGNTVLMVHADAVEVLRGRVSDPIAALPPDRRPGHRLWVYTNFHCNLACDYCCVESSPRTDPRIFEIDDFAQLIDQAASAGVQELFLTGGEPFMLIDLDERLELATATFPTTVLTNAMVWTGERRRRLEALPREGLTFQISLDSATAELHDRHRGEGSYDKAMEGIRTAIDLGFRIRLAATLGADAGDSEQKLEALFDSLDLDEDQRVVRRIARQGAANGGLTVSRASLLPEVCVTAKGVWWHPVAAIDPAMKVSSDWSPLGTYIDQVRDEYRQHRITGDVLASTFPCA